MRVNIQKLIVDPATQNPVATLSGPDKKRALFIWIGPSEARAILVSGIRKGSQATEDGLETGDIIVDIGGQVIENVFYMKKVYAATNESVYARIFRNSGFMKLTLQPALIGRCKQNCIILSDTQFSGTGYRVFGIGVHRKSA